MKKMTFYAYERDVSTRKARAVPMQGYHRQINGVSVYVAKYGGVWRVYDEDSGRWMTQAKTMKGAIAAAESYVARADSFGGFTSAVYKDYCREFLRLRKESTNGLL